MAPIEVDNRTRLTPVKIDISKYKAGKFKHRTKTDVCRHFGGVCPVTRKQRDPEEDVCLTFCIPTRNDREARRKNGL